MSSSAGCLLWTADDSQAPNETLITNLIEKDFHLPLAHKYDAWQCRPDL